MPRIDLQPIVLPDPWAIGDGAQLRAPVESDVEQIAEICRDEDVQRFTRVPHPYTRDDAEGYVRLARRAHETATAVVVVAVDEDDRVLGSFSAGFDHADFSAEAGYWVAPHARRRGLAVRGTLAVVSFAIETLGVEYVALHVAATNAGSQRVAERLGFTLEGRQVRGGVDGPSGDRTAPRVDMLLYGLRRGELVDPT